MNGQEVLKALKKLGKPGTAKIYARHGVAEETWGVPYGALGKLVKRLPVDQSLAEALWRSGVHDARVLATKVADPEKIARRTLESWLGEASNYIITDALSSLAARTKEPEKLAKSWTGKKGEWVAAAGWNVIAILATENRLSEKTARPAIATIVKDMHKRPNRTRHSMNNALIAIGGAMDSLRMDALAAAKVIGNVAVDHGETGCKTPDAAAYIRRMAAHRAKKRSRVTGSRMRAKK